MATAETHIRDRRHIPERRANARTSDESRMSAMDWVAMLFLIVGGLNWGLVGLFDFNLVAALFGEMSAISRVVYVIVGLSALYAIYTSSKMARTRH